MKIRIYTSEYKEEWDNFIRQSKNGTFLLCRDFMEYHQERFQDYSFMFYKNDILIGLIAGHIKEKEYFSHMGLTYGGLIMTEQTKASDVLNIFELLTVTLRQQGFKKITYKAIPHIYHRLPAEEDLYALFRLNAKLIERNISSAILLNKQLEFSATRKRGLVKAKKNGLRFSKSNDFETFWAILSENLQTRYNKQPVHSLSEILYLKKKFLDKIHLFCITNLNDEMIGGCVVFETDEVVHAQYTAATLQGKEYGAIDLLINEVIHTIYPHKKYFDYGTSTEDCGLFFNDKLIYQKEGFGARGIVYDIYSIDL